MYTLFTYLPIYLYRPWNTRNKAKAILNGSNIRRITSINELKNLLINKKNATKFAVKNNFVGTDSKNSSKSNNKNATNKNNNNVNNDTNNNDNNTDNNINTVIEDNDVLSNRSVISTNNTIYNHKNESETNSNNNKNYNENNDNENNEVRIEDLKILKKLRVTGYQKQITTPITYNSTQQPIFPKNRNNYNKNMNNSVIKP